MIFALGFLAASLLALAATPAFWRRAVRLTTKRLAMELPLSMDEVLAGRDLLRAQFAAERRQLEHKIEELSERRAADLAELGNRAGIIARLEADLAALSERSSEDGGERAELQHALAEASAEIAAMAKDSYDTSGLIGRKESEINELKVKLSEAERIAAKRQDLLGELNASMAQLNESLLEEKAKVARLESEISSLRLQLQADKITLRTAAARIAERESALEAAASREKELIRHRAVQAETAKATEAGYIEKIERLRAAQAASQAALEESRAQCAKLSEEIAALKAKDATGAPVQREEIEILRRKISEIGAAVIRAAGGDAGPAEEHDEGTLADDSLPEKATA
jgi:chromosome segregation ATPase